MANVVPKLRLQPQPVFELVLQLTLPHEPQPHGRQQVQVLLQPHGRQQPVEVPPTEPQEHPRQQVQVLPLLPVFELVPPTEPLCCVQVQVQVQVGFAVDVPPTEPVVCLQQGLQHRCWTKSGNVRPLKQPLQEEAILYPSIK